jgi:hypothetical protein
MLSTEQIAVAANRLYEAEVDRQQIPALTLDYPQMNMDDAYAIQKQWVDRKVDEGRTVKGYKIGLTSRAMQMAANIDEPDYGVLLDDMLFEDGATLRAADFLDPRIEVELAFVLKKPLFGDNVSVVDVLNATDYVMPARCLTPSPTTPPMPASSSAAARSGRPTSICAGPAPCSISMARSRRPASPPAYSATRPKGSPGSASASHRTVSASSRAR